MRIVISEFMSLDGVCQAPGGQEEDTEGGFRHGGWSVRFFDPDRTEWFAGPVFDDTAGGVRPAAADVNADGVADVVVGTGPGPSVVGWTTGLVTVGSSFFSTFEAIATPATPSTSSPRMPKTTATPRFFLGGGGNCPHPKGCWCCGPQYCGGAGGPGGPEYGPPGPGYWPPGPG